jgi:hypothetical protein
MAGKVCLLPDRRSSHGGLVKRHGRRSAGSCKSSWVTKGRVRLAITLAFPRRNAESRSGTYPALKPGLKSGASRALTVVK